MTTVEAKILSRVITPADRSLTPEAAQSILAWRFPPEDVDRMTVLSQQANAGTLNPKEQLELDSYERIGHLIALAQSKARVVLKQSSADS